MTTMSAITVFCFLVMRAQGSLRVLLNAKIWSDMIAEKVSTKNIRISAVESDSGKVRIYLITVGE